MTVDYSAVAPEAVSQAAVEDIGTISTTGTSLEKLVLRGQFLTIITLGIYRFWYKTDLRRWYASNTLVGSAETGAQQGFEYRGTAKEKFLGFLYALAVVLPIYFLGTIIGLFASDNLGNIVSSLSVIVIGFLIQYGAYRSRRYRLTRTVWRGLRFDLKGSGWTYALKSAGWGLLTLITLGLAFPAMRRALEEYRINNTWFGSAQGVFTARTGPLMKRWLVLWGGGIVLVILAILYMFSHGAGGFNHAKASPKGLSILLVILGILWPFMLWPWYRANEFRHFTNNTTIGPVSFKSALPTGDYYWLYIWLGLVIFLMLFCYVVLNVILLGNLSSLSDEGRSWSFLAITASLYLILFFLFSTFKETILNRGFWKLTASTLTIHNLGSLDDVIGTSVADETATGEGLADALDFGGI